MGKIDNRDFVVAWATSYNKDDLVKATGMSKAAISARAGWLRKKGVNLPKLSLSSRMGELEIAQLNSLIKKHNIDRR